MNFRPNWEEKGDLPLAGGRRPTGLFRVVYSGKGARWFLYGGAVTVALVSLLGGWPDLIAANHSTQMIRERQVEIEVAVEPVVKTVTVVQRVPVVMRTVAQAAPPAPTAQAQPESRPSSAPAPEVIADVPSPTVPGGAAQPRAEKRQAPATAEAIPDSTERSQPRVAINDAPHETVQSASAKEAPQKEPARAAVTAPPVPSTQGTQPSVASSETVAPESTWPASPDHSIPGPSAPATVAVPAQPPPSDGPTPRRPMALGSLVTLMGRLAPPSQQDGLISAQVMLVDMVTGQTTRGTLQADGAFSFARLRPGSTYYIVAWQHIRNVGGASMGGGTHVSDLRLSWHQVLQVGEPGTFSVELSRGNCDGEYITDVLPASAIRSPGSGRRADVTPLNGG